MNGNGATDTGAADLARLIAAVLAAWNVDLENCPVPVAEAWIQLASAAVTAVAGRVLAMADEP